jgi:hypothetical protein
MIVSLNGVTQAPEAAFTVSGSNITFSSALTSSDVIDYILVLGDVLSVGTPSDGTVGTSQMSYPLGNFSSTGIDDNADAVAITINSSEQVGIGTTSPIRSLQIGDNTAAEIISIQSGTTNHGSIYFGDNAATIAEYSGVLRYQHSDDSMQFWTTSSERMRINSSGNVGIGVTDPSYGKLIVNAGGSPDATYGIANFNGGTSADSFVSVSRGASNQGGIKIMRGSVTDFSVYVNAAESAIISYNGGDTGDGLFFQSGSAATNVMAIDSAGNVGIGIATPADELHVNATGANVNLRLTRDTNTGARISGSDGASTPVIKFDTIASGTATERMRIDSSGNVGIGVSSPTEKLHISGNALVGGEVESVASGTTTGFKWGQDTATHYWKWAEFNNESASLQENSTSSSFSRITVAAGGNVGIGSTSPTSGRALTLNNASNYYGLEFKVGGTSYGRIIQESTGNMYYDANTNIVFRTNTNTERMRIDGSGNVIISGTTKLASSLLTVDGNGEVTNGVCARVNNNAYWNYVGINSAGANSFYVYGDGDVENTNNSYGAISDERVKSNIVDASSQIDDIMAVQVRSYTLNETGATHIGVVAQELEASGMSGLVKTKDDGMKSVKYSILYMKAIKALQEAVTRIETLEAEVAALKGA